MAAGWHAIFSSAEKLILVISKKISLSSSKCCHLINAIHFFYVTTYLIFLTSSVCEVWARGSISSATRPCSTSARNFSRPDNMNGQPKCRGSGLARCWWSAIFCVHLFSKGARNSKIYDIAISVRTLCHQESWEIVSPRETCGMKFSKTYVVNGGVWVTWWYTPSGFVFETYIDRPDHTGRI